jgi:hypothetical protein
MAVSSCLPFLHSHSGLETSDFAPWVRWVESSSRALTRATLFATLRHRQKLHNKQLLLQDLVNDSLSLFPMAALLWFASQPEMRTKPGIRELVTYFCQETADRLYPPSSVIGRIRRHRKDSVVYHLSKALMNGEYAWLEAGIVPCLRTDGQARTIKRPRSPGIPA